MRPSYPEPPQKEPRDHARWPCRCGQPIATWRNQTVYRGKICGPPDNRCFLIFANDIQTEIKNPCERTGKGCGSKSNPGYPGGETMAVCPIFDPQWEFQTQIETYIEDATGKSLEIGFRWEPFPQPALDWLYRKDRTITERDISLTFWILDKIKELWPIIQANGCCVVLPPPGALD